MPALSRQHLPGYPVRILAGQGIPGYPDQARLQFLHEFATSFLRYTILQSGEFGFPSLSRLVQIDVDTEVYAQGEIRSLMSSIKILISSAMSWISSTSCSHEYSRTTDISQPPLKSKQIWRTFEDTTPIIAWTSMASTQTQSSKSGFIIVPNYVTRPWDAALHANSCMSIRTLTTQGSFWHLGQFESVNQEI